MYAYVKRLSLLLLAVVSGRILCSASENEETKETSTPFVEGIGWVKWSDAIDVAKETDRPIMLLVHTKWCDHCAELKEAMNEKKTQARVARLAKHFVMVSNDDDDEKLPEIYEPDGRYVPRVMFLDSNGNLMEEFKNKVLEKKDHFYNYMTADQIITSMKNVMEGYKKAELKPPVDSGKKASAADKKAADGKKKEENDKTDSKQKTEKKKEEKKEGKKGEKESKSAEKKEKKSEKKETDKKEKKNKEEKKKKKQKSEL